MKQALDFWLTLVLASSALYVIFWILESFIDRKWVREVKKIVGIVELTSFLGLILTLLIIGASVYV
jgi:hypothetical protein